VPELQRSPSGLRQQTVRLVRTCVRTYVDHLSPLSSSLVALLLPHVAAQTVTPEQPAEPLRLVRARGRPVEYPTPRSFCPLLVGLPPLPLVWRADLCAGKTCSSHGTCEPQSGNCRCDQDYFGTQCESRSGVLNVLDACSVSLGEFHTPHLCVTDKCTNVVCSNDGRCDPATGACKCTVGWHNVTCDVPVKSTFLLLPRASCLCSQ
jgi:hypothetical protein